MVIFRFDDISINTDPEHFRRLYEIVRRHAPEARILLAISPIVFGPSQLPASQQQRVHPSRLTAMSALDPYYRGERCGVPNELLARTDVAAVRAGHGIVHVDHRLLDAQAQELSIVTSCSLAEATIFVPPYNKWNADTERICDKHGIGLVKFEDGWEHVLYARYRPHPFYYMHTFDLSAVQLELWFEKGNT